MESRDGVASPGISPFPLVLNLELVCSHSVQMGGRKVVQDSDDESNAEGSPPPTDAATLELSLSPIINLQYSSPLKILGHFGETSADATGIYRFTYRLS